MLSVIFLFFTSLALVLWSARGSSGAKDAFQQRLPHICGSLLTFLGFFFFGWINIAPLDPAINFIPDAFEGATFGLLKVVLNFLGDIQAAWLVSKILSLVNLPGWLVLILFPTLHPFLRILLFTIGLTSFLHVLWAVGAPIIPHGRFVSFINRFFGGIALLQSLALIYLLPTLDSLDSIGTTGHAALKLLMGVQLSIGVWMTIFGLLLVAAGSFLHEMGQFASASSNHYEEFGNGGHTSYFSSAQGGNYG